MSARYERVRLDDDEHSEHSGHSASPTSNIPNSPPPSFHSRASSLARRQYAANQSQSQSQSPSPSRTVDPALADAFGHADDDSNSDSDSDADPTATDDRRRLMRSRDALRPLRQPPTQPPQSSSSTPPPPSSSPSTAPARSGRVYGGGIQSDGVFSNLVARPDTGEEKEELPPTYEQAAADAAPPYWETTILAPGLGGLDEVYVDGMPVGSVFSFIWNGMISMSFQVVGFLLTYLLHSTHAAKNGSRAGLGITLIQYGFYMRSAGDETTAPGGNGGMSAAGAAAAGGKSAEGFVAPPDPNAHSFDPAFTLAGLADRDGAYTDLSVCGEVYLAVHHFLLGRIDKKGAEEEESPPSSSQPGKEDGVPLTSLGHIKRIYSHPQAFGQTTAFVRRYFGASPPEMIDTSSTSRAAELAAADESGTSAAISSALAAETTGLDVLARCIEDRPDNTTRFFVLTTHPSGGAPTPLKLMQKQKQKQGHPSALPPPKSLVSFTVPHRSPGALANVLDCFRRAGLNLTSINSLPSLVRPFQYLIFVEFEHSDEEINGDGNTNPVDGTPPASPHERVQRVLDEVAKLAQTYRLLGTWNKPESL